MISIFTAQKKSKPKVAISKPVPMVIKKIPNQIKGLVTLCPEIVVLVQYPEFLPRNPSMSITVVLPSPKTKPAKLMKLLINSGFLKISSDILSQLYILSKCVLY